MSLRKVRRAREHGGNSRLARLLLVQKKRSNLTAPLCTRLTVTAHPRGTGERLSSLLSSAKTRSRSTILEFLSR